MQTSYQYFKNGGAREMPFEKLPKDYGWITGCGGDGWYWNFFARDEDIVMGKGVDPNKVIMCKIMKTK